MLDVGLRIQKKIKLQIVDVIEAMIVKLTVLLRVFTALMRKNETRIDFFKESKLIYVL